MLTAISNAFRVPELRQKILFTLAMIALYRLGAFIPVPGVDLDTVQALISANAALGLLGLFSGGALEKFAVFSLGIMPYITSSIIMQLLQGVIPKVEQWAKEGESGQRKITQITRYMTLGIALLQSIGHARRCSVRRSRSDRPGRAAAVVHERRHRHHARSPVRRSSCGWASSSRSAVSATACRCSSSRASSSRFPQAIVQSFTFGNGLLHRSAADHDRSFIIAAIVTMERAQRRIPVQYAKRVVGRRVYGGSGTYIPLKINGANVVPIIFASAILFFPSQIATLTGNAVRCMQIGNALASGSGQLGPRVRRSSCSSRTSTRPWSSTRSTSRTTCARTAGSSPAFVRVSATTRYIENVLNRITLPGALFLGVIAVVPSMLFYATERPAGSAVRRYVDPDHGRRRA